MNKNKEKQDLEKYESSKKKQVIEIANINTYPALERLKTIASQSFTYNTDINQHIVSCRSSLTIIEEQMKHIKELELRLTIQSEQNRELRILLNDKVTEEYKNNYIKEMQKEIIKENYKIIKELSNVHQNIN